jgi:hypothetical protein
VLFSIRVIQIYGKILHITSKYIEVASDSSHDNERSQYDLIVVQVHCFCTLCVVQCVPYTVLYVVYSVCCTFCTMHCLRVLYCFKILNLKFLYNTHPIPPLGTILKGHIMSRQH